MQVTSCSVKMVFCRRRLKCLFSNWPLQCNYCCNACASIARLVVEPKKLWTPPSGWCSYHLVGLFGQPCLIIGWRTTGGWWWGTWMHNGENPVETLLCWLVRTFALDSLLLFLVYFKTNLLLIVCIFVGFYQTSI